MNVVIAGSRPPKEIRLKYKSLDRWYEKHQAVVEAAVTASGFDVDTVIQGEAQGFDTLASRWAYWNRRVCYGYPAEWKSSDGQTDYSAGFTRNEWMAVDGDALVAVWDESSRGTAHMIQCILDLGKPVSVWSLKQHWQIKHADLLAMLERINTEKPLARRTFAPRKQALATDKKLDFLIVPELVTR